MADTHSAEVPTVIDVVWRTLSGAEIYVANSQTSHIPQDHHHIQNIMSTDPATDFTFGAPALQQQPPSYGSIEFQGSGRAVRKPSTSTAENVFKFTFACVAAGGLIFVFTCFLAGRPPGAWMSGSTV